MRKLGAHEMIMKLRKKLDIPEEPISKEDEDRERREHLARAKRMELAGTEENYVKMFNRDPWTDQWLGPGPEEPMPFLEDHLSKKKANKAIIERLQRESIEFLNKICIHDKLPRKSLPKEKVQVKEYSDKKKSKKKDKYTKEEYQKANWFLQEYAAPWYKDKIHRECKTVEDLMDRCLEEVEVYEQLAEYTRQRKANKQSSKELAEAAFQRVRDEERGIVDDAGLRWEPVDVAYADKKEVDISVGHGIVDIPDEHWEAFSKWERKHPLKDYKEKARNWRCTDISARRIVFLKKVNKKNKKFRKDLVYRDPLTGMAFLSEKKMKKENKKQIARFAKQRRQYAKYVQDMVDKGYLSEDYMVTFLGDDEKAIERVKKRYRDVENRAKEEAKKHKEEEEHKKKRDKERIAWFRKFGYDVQNVDKPFEIIADGEILTFRPCHTANQRLWALDQKGSTIYSEKIESFMQ